MSDNTPTPPVDIAGLLLPISEEKPAGEWLRYEGTFDKIKEARREDDASIPQGIWQTPTKAADWREVARLCTVALTSRTKDLQIGAWLLEAWLYLHGFSGVTAGLKLISGLCTGFWESLYPVMDEDDASFRTAPIEWIDQKVAQKLKMLPITRPEDGEIQPFSFADWELAGHREQEGKRDTTAPADEQKEAGASQEPAISQAHLMTSASMTPRGFMRGLCAELSGVLEASTELEATLDGKLGREFSALHHFKVATQQIRALVQRLAGPEQRPALPGEEDPGATPRGEGEGPRPLGGENGGEADDGGHAPHGRAYGIKSRAEAYQRLQEAADFLMRTEPHSPTPYLVKRAVGWGKMSLVQLLSELVNTPQDLRAIYTLLGMRVPE